MLIGKTKFGKTYISSKIRITEKTFCFKEMIKTKDVFFPFGVKFF